MGRARGHSVCRQAGERWAVLALCPLALTALFSVRPYASGGPTVFHLIPQLAAYACLAVWVRANDHPAERLFLSPAFSREMSPSAF